MTDYFALLEEPRRPWLDPDQLRQKFLDRSSLVHPDHVHGLPADVKKQAQDAYTELNAAYSCLRSPKERLRHLLELELGRRPDEIQRIPQTLMDLFMEIGQVCREADQLLEEKLKAGSPLLKVRLFERSHATTEKLDGLKRKAGVKREEALSLLKHLDEKWGARNSLESGPRKELVARLEECRHLFGYFDRWTGQIQERILQLTLW